MDHRTQFTFYESWFKAIGQLKKKSEQADAFVAICQYALYAEEPGISGPPAAVFESIRPALNIARKKSENGKKGKAKAKENAIKAEANESNSESSESKGETRNSNSNSNSNSNRNRTICSNYNTPPTGEFRPPTVEEVSEYVSSLPDCRVDPNAFVDYYAARGWSYGRGKPMKDWKAAVRTWNRRDQAQQSQADPSVPPDLGDTDRLWEELQESGGAL